MTLSFWAPKSLQMVIAAMKLKDACSFEDHHQLRELAQTHVHGVGAASQPSHPQGSHSPPYRNVMMSN